MTKKYIVDLKTEEQEMLTGLITSGTQRVRKVNHARILLKAADGWTDQQIQASLDVSVATIERVRQRFVEEGLHLALVPRQTRRKYHHLMDGCQEAHLLALACSHPQKGVEFGACACWLARWCGSNTLQRYPMLRSATLCKPMS